MRFSDSQRKYLESPRCAVLASLRSDGTPHQAVVHYLFRADDVIVNGNADRRWVINLRRDPRVSIVVHDAAQPLHWIGLRGHAELLCDASTAVIDAMQMARRYGEDPAEYAELQRVTFKIVPHQVFEYGTAARGTADASRSS